METTMCPHGHLIHSAADRTTQGYCRQCKRDGDRQRRSRNRAAVDLVTAIGAEIRDNTSVARVLRQLIGTA